MDQRRKRRRKKKRERRHLKVVLFLFCAVLITIILAVASGLQKRRDEKKKEQTEKKEQQEIQQESLVVEEKVERIEITLSAAGDCTLGTDENFNPSTNFTAVFNEQNNPAYFFEKVEPIFSEDDLTIVNMEGTLTESDTRMDKQFAFKGDPSYVQILTSGSIEATNLANNHSKDYGEQSYTDTIEYIESAGIQTFGYDRTAVMEVKGIKVGLIGIYELADGLGREQQVKDTIAAVKEQGAQLIVVSFHWGTEREYYPNDVQKTLAHLAIDQGADLVLGHHPHVLQGIEEYNGKNIVYSLGNFCFGGNSNPSDKDTMIFQQTFTFENGELILDNQKNIIPCSLSSVSNRNNYQPMPLEGEEAARVLGRIEEFSSGF